VNGKCGTNGAVEIQEAEDVVCDSMVYRGGAADPMVIVYDENSEDSKGNVEKGRGDGSCAREDKESKMGEGVRDTMDTESDDDEKGGASRQGCVLGGKHQNVEEEEEDEQEKETTEQGGKQDGGRKEKVVQEIKSEGGVHRISLPGHVKGILSSAPGCVTTLEGRAPERITSAAPCTQASAHSPEGMEPKGLNTIVRSMTDLVDRNIIKFENDQAVAVEELMAEQKSGKAALPNRVNRLKHPPSDKTWQEWQQRFTWLIKERKKSKMSGQYGDAMSGQYVMKCSVCVDRLFLIGGVLCGSNAFTVGCEWFKRDIVEKHAERFHKNDSPAPAAATAPLLCSSVAKVVLSAVSAYFYL